MRAAGSCGDQSGRTSAPIRPQAVHTILGHKDPHRHFVRQPIGIHDGAVVAPARGAVDEQIAAAVTAYVTERDGLKGLAAARGMRPHQFSPVFTSLWAAVEVNAVQTKYGFYWGAIADLKNEKHIPMSPKAGMTVEKVSLAVLAVLGVVGLAHFTANALGVLPIISVS
jgi:hypothetical protein